jgi:hypothetical protein
MQRQILGYGQKYDAKHWSSLFSGSNSIPLCSAVFPTDFIKRVVDDYGYRYDFSEDFAFNLIAFCHPCRPQISVVDEICVHQSHRLDDDNVSNVFDRTKWLLDTANGTFDILFVENYNFDDLAAANGDDLISFSASGSNLLNHVLQEIGIIARQGQGLGPIEDPAGHRSPHTVRSYLSNFMKNVLKGSSDIQDRK